jgi:uncharacterized membrane protein
MHWNRWYRFSSYVRSSLWIIPLVAIPLELIVSRLARIADAWLGWNFLGLAVPGATALYQTVVTADLSFIVFTFGSLLVAIQVASGQLTPRIIATTLLRDDVVKYTVGLFIFTLLFALSAMNRMETTVHQTVVFITASLGVASFAAFFYLIDYAARLLRPISVLTRVANAGLDVVQNIYPEQGLGVPTTEAASAPLGAPNRIVAHGGASQIVLAVRLDALLTKAERSNGVIELVPQVGDFVATGEPLFNLYGGAHAIKDQHLRATVAFGSERTLEQDPTFAFRIVIDIGLRALSPAINDPTTAVLALDQVHRMLRVVGLRHLRTDGLVDASGQLRVVCRTPNWEDFVHLAFSEIRKSGSGNLQIVRRLRAMIQNLLQTLPEHRHSALRQELGILDRDIETDFRHAEERALAKIGDSQGLGGH